MDRLTSSRRYFARVVTPIPGAITWYGRVGVTVGLATAFVAGFFSAWAWVLLLLILLGLSVWTGVRLQSEIDDRNRIDFWVEDGTTRQHAQYSLPEGKYRDNTSLWITAHNDGPTAEFLARVEDVVGARRGDRLPARVNEVAWEHDIEVRYSIARGSEARLKLGNVSREPFALWFFTAKTHSYQAPASHASGTRMFDVDLEVSFVLEIYNVDADKTLTADCVLRLSEERSFESFAVTYRAIT